MTITIAPLEPADVRRSFEITEHALARTMAVLYELPLTEETRDKIAAHRISRMFKTDGATNGERTTNEKKSPTGKTFQFKAVDSATGKIVGTSRWEIHYQDEDVSKTIEEQAKARVTPALPQVRINATYAFGMMLARLQRETLALPRLEEGADPNSVKKLRKRVALDLLAVEPDYQGKGIGKALLQWGLDEADRLGLIVYLEATPEGKPLYEKYGFQPVKVDVFDVRPFGLEEDLVHTIMIRQPRPKN